MQKKNLKAIIILLALVLSVTTFVACSKNSVDINTARQSALNEITISRSDYQDEYYSVENINRLNSIAESAGQQIESAPSIEEISAIVSKAKKDFASVLTLEQENELRQDEDKLQFALFKRQKQAELDAYRAMLDDRLFSESNVEKLNLLLNAGKNGIFYSESYDEALLVYDKCVFDILAVPTIEKENEILLQSSKDKAVSSLISYRAGKRNENYSAAAIKQLDDILTAYTDKICSVQTVSEVETLLLQGIVMLDGVSPLELNELEKAQLSAVETLNKYKFNFDEAQYTEYGRERLNEIYESAIAEIQKSDSITEIQSIVDRAQSEMDNVKTYDEEFILYKSDAIAALQKCRDEKSDELYTAEGIQALNSIFVNAMSALEDATTFEAVYSILTDATSALDNVNVSTAELSSYKNARIEELSDYLADFKPNDYTESGYRQLEEIFITGKEDILNAVSSSDVNRIYEEVRLQLNSVLTYQQELTQAKVEAVQMLNEYRLTFDDASYSEYGVKELDKFLSSGITDLNACTDFESLNDSILSTKANLDNVLIYPDELQYRKQNAINEIVNARESKSDAAFSSNGVERLNEIVIEFSSKINLVEVIDEIDEVKQTALNHLNSVPTYSQELVQEIGQKIVLLREYHAEKLNQRYTDDGAVLLELALQNGIAAVSGSTSFEKLEAEFSVAKNNLDCVKTYEEELNDAKQSAEEELRLYRSSKLNGNYTSDGIDKLDAILNNFVNSIWQAENFTVVEQIKLQGMSDLDSVSTHAQELVVIKLNLIDDLKEYRLLKQNVNYTDDGIAKLDAALESGKNEINASQTIEQAQAAFNRAVINLDSIPNANQGIQSVQDAASAALQAHRDAKIDSEYTKDNVNALNIVLSQGLLNISAATTEEQVLSALNKAIAALDEIKSVADTLNDEKAAALIELEKYRATKNNVDYSDDGVKALDAAYQSGKIAIDAAIDSEQINAALLDAKNALDAVLTFDEENDFDIWEIRDSAVEELNDFRNSLNSDDYGDKGIAKLDEIIFDASGEFNLAETPAEVDAVLQKAKDKILAVPTYKEEYQTDLYNYRTSFDDSEYSNEGVVELDATLQKYMIEIDGSSNKADAWQMVVEAINYMDCVMTVLDENRQSIKDSAIAEIKEYRESKLNQNYSEDGNINLDWILSQAVEQITLSSDQQQIDKLVETAKQNMDKIMTIEQINAIEWLTGYRALFDEDDYTDENDDLLDEILENFVNNVMSYDDLQTELANAVNQMDSIATLSGYIRQNIKDQYITQFEDFVLTVNISEYRPADAEIIEDIIKKAFISIQLTEDLIPEIFEQIIADAKNAVADVLTLKEYAFIELQEYRLTFNDEEYSVEGVNELNTILMEFFAAEIEPDKVQEELEAAKSAMDAVEKLSEPEPDLPLEGEDNNAEI